MDLRNFILFPHKVQFEFTDSLLNYIEEKNSPIYKLIISSPFHLDKVKQALEENTNLSITHINKTGIYKDTIIDKEYEYLDISPINVSKGNALQILVQYLNINKQDILSIGDNLNDITMFRNSNVKVAVSNAHELVKKEANYITYNSAENGGFAEVIYKFIPL